MFYLIVFAVWLIGAAASNAAQRVLGMANPCTFGDSFSGDDSIDLICIIGWPIFWPCWTVHVVAERAVKHALEEHSQ